MGKEFNGNIKEAIMQMIQNGTDCCEVTNTVGDFSVTVELTITKIVDKGVVVYDADEEEGWDDDEVLMNDDGDPVLYS
jgi:hypothetical protein